MLTTEQKLWVRKLVSGRDEAFHEYIAGLSDENVQLEIDAFRAKWVAIHSDRIAELSEQRDNFNEAITNEQAELAKYEP